MTWRIPIKVIFRHMSADVQSTNSIINTVLTLKLDTLPITHISPKNQIKVIRRTIYLKAVD